MAKLEIAIVRKIKHESVVSCPFCREQFFRDLDIHPIPEFAIWWQGIKCKKCNRNFDAMTKPPHLPWLNRVASLTRVTRLAQTGSGSGSGSFDWNQHILDGILNLNFEFEENMEYLVKIDIKENPYGIDRPFNEIIFKYMGGKSVIPHFFSDHEIGAVKRYTELNPGQEPPWNTLVELHSKIGFPEGIPYSIIEKLSPSEVIK